MSRRSAIEKGFDGYIVSDCGAVYDVLHKHKYTNSTADTCAATLGAGMDQNCGNFLQEYLPPVMSSLPRESWKRALHSLFRTQMRLGMFERKENRPFAHITTADIDTPEHRQLAHDAALQSIVLLKNDAKLLPLDPDAFDTNRHLVLLGPHVHATSAQLGSYAGIPPYLVTPAQGLAAFIPTNVTQILEGCTIMGDDLSDDAAVLAGSRSTAQVIVFAGLDQSVEAEDLDRKNLQFPGRQRDLIRAVAAAATSPIVLVLLSGGPIDVGEFKNDPKVGAIVYAGYLGQSGGTAIAEILVGVANPSGRLAHTFYSDSFSSSISIEDMHMRPQGTSTLGRTYRFYEGDVNYEFGHGLSYTIFRYNLHTPPTIGPDTIEFTVAVHNVGELIGDEILLCFAAPPRGHGRPLRMLVAFDRIHQFVPGDVFYWNIQLPRNLLKLASSNGIMEEIPGKWILQVNRVDISFKIPAPFSRNIVS